MIKKISKLEDRGNNSKSIEGKNITKDLQQLAEDMHKKKNMSTQEAISQINEIEK